MIGPTVLIIGSGASARAAAEAVAEQGGEAVIVARTEMGAVGIPSSPGRVKVLDDAEVTGLEGGSGGLIATLAVRGERATVRAGAIVVAVDNDLLIEAGAHTMALSKAQTAPLGEDVRTVAIVLGPEAPRDAHRAALELALRLRTGTLPREVILFTEEVVVLGRDEILYAEAQRAGMEVVRTAGMADIAHGERPRVIAVDRPSGIAVTMEPDLLIIADGRERTDPSILARPFIAPVDGDKIIEAGVSRGPGASVRDGVFLCGTSLRRLPHEEQMALARTAAVRAFTAALQSPDLSAAASVDQERCSACLTCVRSCPFSAPRMGGEGKAEVVKELCQACGICVASCPSRAISLPSDAAMEKMSGTEEAGR